MTNTALFAALLLALVVAVTLLMRRRAGFVAVSGNTIYYNIAIIVLATMAFITMFAFLAYIIMFYYCSYFTHCTAFVYQ